MKKTMHWTLGLALAGLVLVGAGCASVDEAIEPNTETEETGESEEVTLADGMYALELEASTLAWSSKKVGGAHNGVVAINSGSLDVTDGMISGGAFEIGMDAITVLDIEDEASNASLVEHLESEDFFAVADYPTAEFTVTEATENTLTGDLTIKGITNEVSFAYAWEMDGDNLTVTAAFPIDRVQWEINFGSESIADRVENVIIDDEIEYELSLVFEAPAADDAEDANEGEEMAEGEDGEMAEEADMEDEMEDGEDME